MDEIRGANRQTSVSRGGLHEYLFERRLVKNFPLATQLNATPPGEAHRLLACACNVAREASRTKTSSRRACRDAAPSRWIFFHRGRGIA